MFRAVRMMPCDVSAVSFLEVQFKSKHLRENKRKFSVVRIFEFFERSEHLWPETCHHNPLPAVYFSVHSTGKCFQLFMLQEKTGLCFLLNGLN